MCDMTTRHLYHKSKGVAVHTLWSHSCTRQYLGIQDCDEGYAEVEWAEGRKIEIRTPISWTEKQIDRCYQFYSQFKTADDLARYLIPKAKRIDVSKGKWYLIPDGKVPSGCEELFCSNNHLTELLLPSSCKRVGCSNNLLTELVVPDGCVFLDCSHNPLLELFLPKGCKRIICTGTKIQELIVPEGCLDVVCFACSLIKLVVPEGCLSIGCSNNFLTELKVPKSCKMVVCHKNFFTELTVPKKCEVITNDVVKIINYE